MIEPDFISDAILQTPLKWHIPFMMWLVDELNKEFSNIYPIEIDFIAAKYHQHFPCIGLHYLNKNPSNLDLEPVILKKLEQIYNTSSFLNFNKYIMEHQDKIRKEVARFKELYGE